MIYVKHTFFFFIFTCFLLTSCNKTKTIKINEKVKTASDPYNMPIDEHGLSKSIAIIKTKYGNISFKFYPKAAPNTVSRIISLINKGFYDGLIFHRAISDFIIQTGDPTSSGNGGSGKKIKAEISNLQHIKGTIAMARSLEDIDSADSQFYISLRTLKELDSKYTVFGQVFSGMEILDKISVNDKILSIELINSL